MYPGHSVRRKDGKKHIYWRLVRSVRRNGKALQETVAQLGELDAEGRAKAKALARQIAGRREQRSGSRSRRPEKRRSRRSWIGSPWSEADRLATSGWAGACGRHSG